VAGLVFTYGYNGVGAVLRGLGDSRTPLYMLIIATLLNVVLDLAFVVLFGWGVAGVAWATVIAQAVSFLGSLLYLNRTHELLRTNFLALRFDRELFAAILKIGLPTGIQQTLVSLGLMFMSAVVNGYGTDVMAGFSAASRIDSFAAMPAMNLSMALSSFVGQNLGAGRPDRARRGFKAALLIGLGITAVLVVFLLLAGDRLVGIFSAIRRWSPSESSTCRSSRPSTSPSRPCSSPTDLRGAGEAIVPLVSTLVAMWLVRVPAAALFSSLWARSESGGPCRPVG
jgi:putative MATE family efflux protein